MTVQLLLGHGLAPRADFQRPARPGIGRVSLPWSQGSVWRGSALGSSEAVRTLWADCRDGLLCLRLPELAMRHCSTIIIASRGQPRLPQQGRPAAGPPPWRALPAEAVCMTLRQYRLPDATPHARHPESTGSTGRDGAAKEEGRPCTLRSVICVPFLEQADDGDHSSSEYCNWLSRLVSGLRGSACSGMAGTACQSS